MDFFDRRLLFGWSPLHFIYLFIVIFLIQVTFHLAWISSDYFESSLLPQLLRGENDSKQSDEFQATFHYVIVYKNCADLYKSGSKISGVYKINPDGLGEFEVYCDQKTAGGGWTVFQKRQDGSVDFYRAWNDYKKGFGNLNGEFWLGLDKINRLTVSGSYKLRVDLEDLQGSTAFAEYSSFAVTSERVKYKLSLGSYSGTSF